jgi:tRNA pseudouridine55 synthase
MAEYVLQMNKSYRAELTLGYATDTEDSSGRVTAEKDVPQLDEHTVSKVMAEFLGTVSQIPPMYSAVRSKGRRLYELARRGEDVERTARQVNIYHLRLHNICGHRIQFDVTCSRGTYVRTLCVSIAEKLGTYGHMSSLLRTAVGPFLLSEAYTIQELEALSADGRLGEAILPADIALQHLPALFLEDEDAARIITGRSVSAANAAFDSAVGAPEVRLCRLYHESGRFLAVARNSGNMLYPEKVFWTAD